MDNMNITSAQYVVTAGETIIKATIDGIDMFVPIEAGNRHYDEIMRQVAAGSLTIADAE